MNTIVAVDIFVIVLALAGFIYFTYFDKEDKEEKKTDK